MKRKPPAVNQHLAQLLGEVKLAEKRLQKAQDRVAPAEARIKAALRAGDRASAERYALDHQEVKLELERARKELELARAAHARGQEQARGLTSTRGLQEIARAQEGLVGALGALTDQDELVRKLDEEAAVADARLDVALDDADRLHPGALAGPAAGPTPPLPPLSTAEDILRELEDP